MRRWARAMAVLLAALLVCLVLIHGSHRCARPDCALCRAMADRILWAAVPTVAAAALILGGLIAPQTAHFPRGTPVGLRVRIND